VFEKKVFGAYTLPLGDRCRSKGYAQGQIFIQEVLAIASVSPVQVVLRVWSSKDSALLEIEGSAVGIAVEYQGESLRCDRIGTQLAMYPRGGMASRLRQR
jgi:hypothetical protein